MSKDILKELNSTGEYDLTFLEAHKALMENKCKGINSERGATYLSSKVFSGKWRLIGKKSKKEK